MAATFGVAAALPTSAAVTKYWAALDGSWTDLDWSIQPNGAPTLPPPDAGDTGNIVFNDGITRTITYVNPGYTNSLRTLTIDNTGGGVTVLNQAQDFLGTMNGFFIAPTGSASFNLSGGTVSVSSLNVATSAISAVGHVNMTGGTLVAAPFLQLGGFSGGAGAFAQTSGSVNAGSVTVFPTSSYDLGGDGTLGSTAGTLAGLYTQTGRQASIQQATVSGTSSISGGTLTMGTTRLTLSGALSVAGGTVTLGTFSTSNLRYAQTGGSVTTPSATFAAGGSTAFSISDGTFTSTANGGSTRGIDFRGTSVNQSGGTIVTSALYMTGPASTYAMSGGTLVATAGAGVNFFGANVIQGGAIVASALVVGGDASNTYTLNGGAITATAAPTGSFSTTPAGVTFDGVNVVQNGGAIVTTTFSQGGTNSVYQMNGGSITATGPGTNRIAGGNGSSTFDQSAGSLAVAGSLAIAPAGGIGQSTYLLGGAATLDVGTTLYVGGTSVYPAGGAGVVDQLAGSRAHASRLAIGEFNRVGRALYTIEDGAALAVDGEMLIGYGDVVQNGGTVSAGAVTSYGTPANRGSYTLNNGSLLVSGSAMLGAFLQTGGLFHAKSTQLGLSQFPLQTQSAFTLNQGTVLVDANFSSVQGTYTQNGGGVSVGGDFVVLNSGTSLVTAGNLNVGGTLRFTSDNNIGYAVATFLQTGGSIQASSMLLGPQEPPHPVGLHPTSFVKTGGALTLSTGSTSYVGYMDPASFSQTGGTFDSGPLIVGYQYGVIDPDGSNPSTFLLSGGTVNVTGDFTIDQGAYALYSQTGGTAVVSGSVVLGHHVVDSNGRPSSFSVSGGSLTVAGGITNTGVLNFSGGNLNTPVIANVPGAVSQYTNPNSLRPQLFLSGTGVRSLNALLNSGTVNVQATTGQFTGVVTNNAAYISTNSDNRFTTLTNGPVASLQGGAADRFRVSADLLSSSTNAATWSTDASTLEFLGGTGNAHVLSVTGADVGGQTLTGFSHDFGWGALQLDAGQSLTLQDGNADAGGALYVDAVALADGLGQIGSITGNGLNVYYNATDPVNAYLGGQTYPLVNGGFLVGATPEPAVLALAGVAATMGLNRSRRKTKNK